MLPLTTVKRAFVIMGKYARFVIAFRFYIQTSRKFVHRCASGVGVMVAPVCEDLIHPCIRKTAGHLLRKVSRIHHILYIALLAGAAQSDRQPVRL